MSLKQYKDDTIVIPSGSATSNSFKLGQKERVVAVVTPASWDAADIGFETSYDSTNFFRVVDPLRVTAATSHARIINVETGVARVYVVPECLDLQIGAEMKLTSISTGSNADVNQTEDRTLLVYIMAVSGA